MDESSVSTTPRYRVEGLNDFDHKKFKSIDVKLGVAMTSMLRAGSDKAADIYLEVNRKANDDVRSFEGKIIKGKQIIAMMYESFRARDRLDMIVSLDYLVKLQYQGDNKLHQFKQTWLEILTRMREEDIPSEKALRDCLYNKIKDSPAMKMELALHYEHLTHDDPKRSYANLLSIIDRTIMRRREQSNLVQTQVGLRQMLEGKDLLAAPAKPQLHPPKGDSSQESPTREVEHLATQLPCFLKARQRPAQRRKPSRRKQPGVSRPIPNLTEARSTLGVSFTSPKQDAEMATYVHSAIPTRPLRLRCVREPQVRPANPTTRCVVRSGRQDRAPGRTAHSSMKQHQPLLRRQHRSLKQRRSPRLKQSQSLNPALRLRSRQRRRSSRLLQLFGFYR